MSAGSFLAMIPSRSWGRLLRAAVIEAMPFVSAADALLLVPAELSAAVTWTSPVSVVAIALW